MTPLAINRSLTALLLAELVAALWALPLFRAEFWLSIRSEILIWRLFAASANLLLGHVGLLSFGQALYFGFGMYGVAIGVDRFGLGFWGALGFVVATFAFQARIYASPLGRAFVAIREGERKAALLGIDVLRVRWIAFVIAGRLVGLAGALFAFYGRYASATYMYYLVSGEAVIWTIIGGAGTLLGPAPTGCSRRWRRRPSPSTGPQMARLRAAAKRHDVFVSMSFTEGTSASVGCMWNSNVLIGPDGAVLNHHRKLMSTYYEKLVWAPGDGAGLRVVETRIGRVGALICGENTNPFARFALMA